LGLASYFLVRRAKRLSYPITRSDGVQPSRALGVKPGCEVARMRRIVGIFMLFASLVLLGLTAWLWRRSHRVSDVVTWVGGTDTREVASYAGAVHVWGVRPMLSAFPSPVRTRSTEPVPADATWRTRRRFDPQVVWSTGGFAYASGSEVSSFLPLTSYQSSPTPANVAVQGGSSTILLDTTSGIMPPTKTPAGSNGVTISGGSLTLTKVGSGTLVIWPLSVQQVVVVPYWAVAAVVGAPLWWTVLMLPRRVRSWRRRPAAEAE
jgi:hypothetical protein